MAFLAEHIFPGVLEAMEALLFCSYREWRIGSKKEKPSDYLLHAEPHDKPQRAATLLLCGYLFFPDSTELGVADIFQQLNGEGMRFGELDIRCIDAPIVHAGMLVDNKLDARVFGYAIRGHSARTLRCAHRFILLDAVRYFVEPSARWAKQAEVPVTPRYPHLPEYPSSDEREEGHFDTRARRRPGRYLRRAHGCAPLDRRGWQVLHRGATCFYPHWRAPF